MCREQLIDGVRHAVGLPERGDREPLTINVADYGHDLKGVPICVVLVAFCRGAIRDPRESVRLRKLIAMIR